MPNLPCSSNNKKDRRWGARLLGGMSLRPSQPSFVVNSVRNIHTVTAADINAESSKFQTSDTSATSQLAPAQQQGALQQSRLTSSTSHVAQGKQPLQRDYFVRRPDSSTTSISQASLSQSVGPPRCYEEALHEENNLALRQGEYDHNIKNWIPQDSVLRHEARKELVPTICMNKIANMDARAHIEEQRQRSRRALEQQQVRSSKLPGGHLIKARGHDDCQVYKLQTARVEEASQSVHHLRSSNASVLQQLPVSTVYVDTSQRRQLRPGISLKDINKSLSASSRMNTRSSSNFEGDTASSSAFADEGATQPSKRTFDLWTTRTTRTTSDYFTSSVDNLPIRCIGPRRGTLTRAEGYQHHMAKMGAARKANYEGTSYGAGSFGISWRGGSRRGTQNRRVDSPLSKQVTQPHVLNPSITFDDFTQQIQSGKGKCKGYVPLGDPRGEFASMSSGRRLANKWSSPKPRARSSTRKAEGDGTSVVSSLPPL